MSGYSDAKIFGGIGSLLTLVGAFIPFIGPFISIIGFILLLIAVKNISVEVKDKIIYKNYLISFFCNIIAIIVVFIILLIIFRSVGGFSFIQSIETANITDFNTFWEYFSPVIQDGLVALIIGWILLSIGTFYLRKSYYQIAEHTKIDLFRKTGLIYFVGAITIILLIGLIILIIARIFEIVTFLSLPDKTEKI